MWKGFEVKWVATKHFKKLNCVRRILAPLGLDILAFRSSVHLSRVVSRLLALKLTAQKIDKLEARGSHIENIGGAQIAAIFNTGRMHATVA